jgi:hypothetical protein
MRLIHLLFFTNLVGYYLVGQEIGSGINRPQAPKSRYAAMAEPTAHGKNAQKTISLDS